MNEGVVDAVILAGAGLKRLGHAGDIREWISPDIMLPAIGQGALGLEIREEDETTGNLARSLSDRPTHIAVAAERGVLKSLNGGCQVPIAAFAVWESPGHLILEGRVLNLAGTRRVRAISRQSIRSEEEAQQVGIELGSRLLAEGAGEILDSILNRHP